jgi:hypothetical protein
MDPESMNETTDASVVFATVVDGMSLLPRLARNAISGSVLGVVLAGTAYFRCVVRMVAYWFADSVCTAYPAIRAGAR